MPTCSAPRGAASQRGMARHSLGCCFAVSMPRVAVSNWCCTPHVMLRGAVERWEAAARTWCSQSHLFARGAAAVR